MIKKMMSMVVIGAAMSTLSLPAIADSCNQQYQGINFIEATIFQGQVTCAYTPSVYYVAKTGSHPESGPWKAGSYPGNYTCFSSQASSCQFS